MLKLIRNEFYKLKRQCFLLFCLLLTLIPVFTGGMAAVLNEKKSFIDLFFFINNQYSMFYPMVVFIIISTLFYSEYKNRTFITWILYGYNKKRLFMSKIIVGMIISVCMAGILFISFLLFTAVLYLRGSMIFELKDIGCALIGFFAETILIMPVTILVGATVINISRNIVISSVIGIFYGFFSCLFIGMDKGYLISGAFAYRVCMLIIDPTSFYEDVYAASIKGISAFFISLLITLTVSFFIFAKKKKIEK